MNVHLKCSPNNSNNSNICYISQKVFNFLNLNKKKKYRMNFGKLSSEVQMKPSANRDEKNTLYFQSNIFQPTLTSKDKLNLEDFNLNIYRKGDNIYLGPVLGIFVKPNRLSVYNNNTIDPIHLEAG
ncbi:hypothetical protein [Natranaerobius trueperi]|uniref:Uncharacterized protein n=1 Tax=Natranaerobius trueperi TaxID=759412 RepID=A0A226BX57_9FIRM|nr:hypothetical protein [Natranaerobius trueperi]OWZ82779.1 hypothetical protein CDO51_12240 [Natranaerobius trueperi]